MIRSACLAFVLIALIATGCRTHTHGPTRAEPGRTASGPPAHAPAHGYRAKNPPRGGHIVFDAGCGAYVVVGLPAGDPHHGWHYRQTGGFWMGRYGADGDWHPVDRSELPPGLESLHGSDHHPGRGRGHGQAHGRSS